MTEQEAKMVLEQRLLDDKAEELKAGCYCYYSMMKEAHEKAIQALEKQIPYKPKEYEDRYYACKCGNILLMKWDKYPTKEMSKSCGLPYCLNCGQAIDWSEEE